MPTRAGNQHGDSTEKFLSYSSRCEQGVVVRRGGFQRDSVRPLSVSHDGDHAFGLLQATVCQMSIVGHDERGVVSCWTAPRARGSRFHGGGDAHDLLRVERNRRTTTNLDVSEMARHITEPMSTPRRDIEV